MHVVIADINEEKGRKKAEELQGIFIKTDVSEVVRTALPFCKKRSWRHNGKLSISGVSNKWNL